MNRKYTHGLDLYGKIRLYYQKGKTRKYDDISNKKCDWYFFIKKSDCLAHGGLIKGLVAEELIKSISDYNDEYVKVVTLNRNLSRWKLEEGATDDKITVLNVLHSFNIETYEDDITSVERYCIDNNVQIEDDYNIGYYDIETDDRAKGIEIGRDKILSMAVTDVHGDPWYGTSKNEGELLEQIVSKLRQYTIILGFYSKGFDLPYIKERCQRFGIIFDMSDIIHIDMHAEILRVYMMDKKGPKTYDLDAVCKHFNVGEKLPILKTGFYDTWLHEPEVFKKYNIHDTTLLKLLDDKLQMTQTMILQAKMCGVFLNKFWNTNLTDKFLLKLAHENKVVLPSARDQIKNPMPGGRVDPVVPAIYDNIAVFDFAAMYANVIQSFNMSPETLVIGDPLTLDIMNLLVSPINTTIRLLFREIKKSAEHYGFAFEKSEHWWDITLRNIPDDKIREFQDDVLKRLSKYITIKLKDKDKRSPLLILYKFINIQFISDKKLATIRYNFKHHVFFRKDEIGLIPKMIEIYKSKRAEAKADMANLVEGTDEYKLAYAYNIAYKLMGNITYGYTASEKTRAYNEFICNSITLGGQTIKDLLKKFFVKNNLGVVLYGDTDSVFAQVNLTNYNNSIEEFDKYFQKAFGEYLSNVLKKVYNIDNHTMVAEYEKFYDRLLLVKKKTYVGYTKEGNKFDATGINYIKRDTILYTVKLQKELSERLLVDETFKDRSVVEEWIKEVKERFYNIDFTTTDVQDFVIHKRIKKHPDLVAAPQTQHRLVKRMLEEGQQFVIGDVIEYIIVEALDGNTKHDALNKTDFTVRRNDTMEPAFLNKDKYWTTYIFAPLKRCLETAWRDYNWNIFETAPFIKREQKAIIAFKKGISNPLSREVKLHTLVKRKAKLMHHSVKIAILDWAFKHGHIGQEEFQCLVQKSTEAL